MKLLSRLVTCSIVFVPLCLSSSLCTAQSSPDQASTLRGTVINSVTREPVGRALVYSPDNRFATMTDSQGHFEFILAKTGDADASNSDSPGTISTNGNLQVQVTNRPSMLVARKPGFLVNQDNIDTNRQLNSGAKEITIPLVPEAVISGTVTLPSSEAPDSIFLQIYRRQVQDGRAIWMPSGGTQSKSDGSFRLAELSAGTYKVLTRELLDRDPLTFDARGQLYGYPPVYSQNAPDFASAGTIQVAAGGTAVTSFTLVKQPYYRVRIGVASPQPDAGIGIDVYVPGRKGPGFTLGYNNRDHAIEGMLPNGTYTVEASSYGRDPVSGLLTFTVKGAAVDGLRLTMVPTASISVDVTEEFTSEDHSAAAIFTGKGRSVALKGPQRYLHLWLEPADDFEQRGGAALRAPTGPGDEALVIENVRPGRYWVRVNSSRGFPASIRSGGIDLEHQPLVVGVGGSTSPIEVTMRDDAAQIEGTVEGITPSAIPAPGGTNGGGSAAVTFYSVSQSAAHIYCIPLPDSSGQFTEIWVSPDGSFTSPQMSPGAYRLLAFDRAQPELEYRNPEAMRAYDAKGPVVRLAPSQKEHVRLQLIFTSE